MTGDQSRLLNVGDRVSWHGKGQARLLNVGDRVSWHNDRADQGIVTEKNWAGVTIKWDNRSEQTILHNDMAQVERVPSNLV
jgi:hypothetical protein